MPPRPAVRPNHRRNRHGLYHTLRRSYGHYIRRPYRRLFRLYYRQRRRIRTVLLFNLLIFVIVRLITSYQPRQIMRIPVYRMSKQRPTDSHPTLFVAAVQTPAAMYHGKVEYAETILKGNWTPETLFYEQERRWYGKGLVQ